MAGREAVGWYTASKTASAPTVGEGGFQVEVECLVVSAGRDAVDAG
ncbi:MAG: hypothetical protein H7839_23860 [Magnetococcus sp. YQC-5]